MRLEDMPSPGPLANGYALQKEALKAINYLTLVSEFTGSTDTAPQVREFFLACAEACKPFIPKKGK